MIRRARPTEAARLAQLHRTVFPDGAWDDDFWREAMRHSFDHVLVAGRPPNGFALVRMLGDEAELITIGTTQPREGVGRALLAASAALCVSLGAERLFLEVSMANKAALALYRKVGFEMAGTRPGYYQDGSDAAIMRLLLPTGGK
jgi:ribosomal-protein-alanine N-acetyltransferase